MPADRPTSRYRPQSRDTDERVDRLLFDRWRALSPAEKARIVTAATQALHRTHLAGLRRRHPDDDERTLEDLAARIRLGDELFEAAHRERVARGIVEE